MAYDRRDENKTPSRPARGFYLENDMSKPIKRFTLGDDGEMREATRGKYVEHTQAITIINAQGRRLAELESQIDKLSRNHDKLERNHEAVKRTNARYGALTDTLLAQLKASKT